MINQPKKKPQNPLALVELGKWVQTWPKILTCTPHTQNTHYQ